LYINKYIYGLNYSLGELGRVFALEEQRVLGRLAQLGESGSDPGAPRLHQKEELGY